MYYTGISTTNEAAKHGLNLDMIKHAFTHKNRYKGYSSLTMREIKKSDDIKPINFDYDPDKVVEAPKKEFGPIDNNQADDFPF